MTNTTKSFIKQFEEVLCFYHKVNKDEYEVLFVQDGGGSLRVVESISKDELNKMKYWRNFAEKFIKIENEIEWRYRLVVGADPTAASNIRFGLQGEEFVRLRELSKQLHHYDKIDCEYFFKDGGPVFIYHEPGKFETIAKIAPESFSAMEIKNSVIPISGWYNYHEDDEFLKDYK